MNSTVACCYLTYNHPEVVEQILERICDTYREKGIDIYYYDSSTDEKTEEIIKKYQDKGYDNIYYVDVKFIKSGDEKYLYVIQGNGLKKHYDYIWPTKDRIFFRGKALDEICESMEQGNDVIFAVNEEDRWELVIPKVKDVYEDPAEFFSHYGQLCTNWEAFIRKTSTMVDGVDWDAYAAKYKVGPDNNFNQLITGFARLSELEKCSIRVVHHEPMDKLCSVLAKSMWRNSFMKVWVDTWIPAIFSLPDIYNPHKLNIIKSELGLFSLFGSTESLIQLREEGILDYERYSALSDMWEMITDYPKEFFELLMLKDDSKMLTLIRERFEKAFAEKDYPKAYLLHIGNEWLSMTMEKEDYEIMKICFTVYKNEINKYGKSLLFEGVTSVNELISKYKSLTEQK